MTLWTAASTLILFAPPAASVNGAVPAVGPGKLFSGQEFEKLWTAFFPDEKFGSPLCGSVKEVKYTDAQLMNQDRFLVFLRGFRSSVCQPSAWYVSAMRIDPCRLRLKQENKTAADLRKCSRDGQFSEIRVVLQPVEKTDRGAVFPDVALHAAFSVPKIKDAARLWKSGKVEDIISYMKQTATPNDVSLFLGGAGLERWTFARVVFSRGQWTRDRLAHGGYYESFSDADLGTGVVRTQRPAGEETLAAHDFLNPLRVHPLQGSCAACHLAERGSAERIFRQLGWGLAGESIISQRVRAEANLAAKELQLLGD